MTVLQIFVLTGILFFLSWQTLEPLHFLISDTGLRFMQVQELVSNNWQTLAMSYPQRIFDPELRYLPYTGAAVVIDNQIFLLLSPFFNIAAAYFYKILGPAGLAVVPTLGAVLTAVPLYRIARLSHLPYTSLLLWTTVIATPILLYSVKLWDHTIATALGTWAVYLIIRGLQERSRSGWFLLAGGICLGLGLGQRPEMYPFTLAVAGGFLLAAWPAFRAGFIVAAGGLLGALPVWLAQWLWVGHPLGLTVGAIFFGYGRVDSGPVSTTTITEQSLRLIKIVNFLVDIQPQDWLAISAILLILARAVILVVTIRSQPDHLNQLLPLALLLLLIGYVIQLEESSHRLIRGILPTFPLLPFALIYPNLRGRWLYNKEVYRFVALTAVLFLALMFIFWPAFGGYQWGSRYLLPAYPLLLFMGWFAFATYEQFFSDSRKGALVIWRSVALCLLLTAILLQISGVRTLRMAQQQNGKVQAALADLPVELIITDHPFLPTAMAALKDKQFLYITKSEDIEELVPRFAAAGIRQIGIAPGARFAPGHAPLVIPERVGDITLREVEPFVYELHSIVGPK
jgi:hypothetical protein